MLSLTLLVILAGAGAASDLVSRKIPNWLNLLILVVGVILLIVTASWSGVWPHLLHFAIALAASLILFKFGMWGGGDAKFYSALAVWFPLTAAPLLALFVAVSGVAVLLLMAIWSKFKSRPNWSRELPYGAAIASGAIITAVVTAN
ncbi:A24 family peptidase [Erythrobacter alti]|uniref:A24 family peptidase n=1 Tax=Erythrobacter alti TaxID=1896145 RepID=UPI0030F3E960